MATLGPGYFLTLTETATGDYAWTNPQNALAFNGSYASVEMYSTADESHTLDYYNWELAGSIKDSWTINSIKVEVYGYEAGSGDSYFKPRWASYSLKAGADVNASPTWEMWIGDGLSYWGMTNAQAIAALRATSATNGFRLYALAKDSNTCTTYIDAVRVTVDYTGGKVQLPISF